MPSLLRWNYTGDEEPADHGEQRVHAGDAVIDDDEGMGKLAFIDGSSAYVEFSSGERKEIKQVSKENKRLMEKFSYYPEKIQK